MAPPPTFAERLQERIALLPHNIEEPDEPEAQPEAAPAGRGRRRRRQATAAQLRKREQRAAARAEKARAKEARYDRRVKKAEGFARKKRFTRHRQIGVFCGVTTAGATQGPNLDVFVAQNVLGNFHYKARGVDGRLRWVGHNHVRFANNFASEQANQAAKQRYLQARALEAMEQAGLENEGFLTKAEADMAARHPDAWVAAVKKAKAKGLYTGDDVVGFDEQQQDDQDAAAQLFEQLVNTYEVDVSAEGICHAANFFLSQRYDFPEGFDSEHLDLFLVTYATAMVYHPDPRRNLARVGCIEQLRHGNRRHLSQIMELARETVASDAGLEAYDQSIITLDNVGVLRFLNPIAHADALPPALDFRGRQTNDRAAMAALRNPNTPGLPNTLLSALEDRNDLIGQRSFSIPDDFSNWDKWFPYFFPDRELIPTIPYNCIPRVGVSASGNLAGAAAIKLRLYQRKLAPHCNDVVVFFVWEAIRRAAAEGEDTEMDDLYADVRRMINGEEPVETESSDDESESESESDEEPEQQVGDGVEVFGDNQSSDDEEILRELDQPEQ